jgi:CRP/FNR family cyclic AMP-dependent transcriptional regulator
MTMTSSEAIQKESYKTGQFIFFEGEFDKHFYIVESGAVQIFTMTKAGERVNICQINEGESFGEFALLDDKARSASAQAINDVSLIRVSPEGFQELLTELPGWANSMLKSFVDRLKNMTSLLKDADQFPPKS